jgi:hypothetical protein
MSGKNKKSEPKEKTINEECKACSSYLTGKCKGRYNFKVPCLFCTREVKK